MLIGYPLVRGIYLSLTDATEANHGPHDRGQRHPRRRYEFVGLRQLHRRPHRQAVVLGAARPGPSSGPWPACVLHYGIGLGLAVLLNRPMRGRAVYRVLLILPWAVPGFVSAFAWRFLFNERATALINACSEAAASTAVGWLDDPTWAKIAVIAVNIWLGVPFMMVAAARRPAGHPRRAVRGGGDRRRERRGSGSATSPCPGLRPCRSTVILLGTIWTFNMFPVIFLLTGADRPSATEILVTCAYREAFEGIRELLARPPPRAC